MSSLVSMTSIAWAMTRSRSSASVLVDEGGVHACVPSIHSRPAARRSGVAVSGDVEVGPPDAAADPDRGQPDADRESADRRAGQSIDDTGDGFREQHRRCDGERRRPRAAR